MKTQNESLRFQHSLSEGDSFAEPFSIFGMGTVSGEADPFIDNLISGFVRDYFESAADCNIIREPIYEGTAARRETANPYSIFSDHPTFYQYLGSRTAPPCEEDVFWNYYTSYITIDDAQERTLRSFILNWVNPETCRLGTVADPDTGSTTRPAIDPGSRPVSWAGECASS